MDTRDIFLSHRSTDKEFVRQLAGDIESEYHRTRSLLVWLDEAEIRPGQSIPGMINEGLEKSRFIGLVMTPNYFNSGSGWTDAEWHSALHSDPDNKNCRIIPIIAQDCPYIPFLLRHLYSIDFRGRYDDALKELLAVLKDEPLPRPVAHRGQLISTGNKIDRSTLVAERAAPQADPDITNESLYCNLLPVEIYPPKIYIGGIHQNLIKTKANGKESLPSKYELKEKIKDFQERQGIDKDKQYMPAFRVHEDRIISFHDLDDPDSPLAAIVDEHDTEVYETRDFIRDEDYRKIIISLMNMSLVRHLFKAGLIIDEDKISRYFLPQKDGGTNSITWRPFKKQAERTVVKPIIKDGSTTGWLHQGAYIKILFLANKFYIKITPTWVLTSDGIHPKGGPDVGRIITRWTGRERNLQILYHVRFWTSILRNGRSGPISIRAGDQVIQVSIVPAFVQQAYGITNDQKDILRLLDEEAPLLSKEEDELVENVLESEFVNTESIDEDDVLEEETEEDEEFEKVT